jgi:outer membrane cobalamin receptor
VEIDSVLSFVYIFLKNTRFMNISYLTIVRAVTVIFLLLHSQNVFAQNGTADSTIAKGALNPRADSVFKPLFPISLIGTVDRLIDTDRVISDPSIVFTDYRDAMDLLRMSLGIFIRDLGSPGQLTGLTIQGIDARGIAVLSDGILLNDPLTGIFDLSLYPTEHINRIEIISGTRSFLYGLNGNSAAINFISKSKKAIHPFSRIRYSESTYGYGFFDGMFSQDIIRGLNMTAGVQHITTKGRFANSGYDHWNARIKLRYNISNSLNVYFSEMYNQTLLGLNGGVDSSTPPELRYEGLQATVRNIYSHEKITRHDVQIGIATRFLPDSNAVSMLTLYHSTNFREYRDEESGFNSNGLFIQQDHRSQWYGAKLTQNLNLGSQQLDFGVEIQSRGVIESPATGQRLSTLADVYGKTALQPFEMMQLAIYSRLDNYQGQTELSYGSDVAYEPFQGGKVFCGYSRSFRFPTIQELNWQDNSVSSTNTSFSVERHHLIEAGMSYTIPSSFSIDASFFHRIIWNPIAIVPTYKTYPFPTLLFMQQQKKILDGVTLKGDVRLWKLFADGSAQFIETATDGINEIFLPKWSLTGGIYFWGKLFGDHLDLKTGIRGRALSRFDAVEYNPQALMFVPGVGQQIETVGVADLILIAHLGNAYVHFIFDNVFDRQYITTSFYPMPDRALRFGISWEFSD